MVTRRAVRGRKSHVIVVSINQCILHVSIDRSVGKYAMLSAGLLMCPSVHFFCPLTDRSID